MATAHLIHGFLGAGKTTFAKNLQSRVHAVRFSPDEWMISLHGDNPPADKFREYEDAILSLIWQMAEQTLYAGCDVILDFGFWRRTSRDDARDRLNKIGAAYQFYNLNCDVEVMRARVKVRTDQMPHGALYIDEMAFNNMLRLFEPMQAKDEEFESVTAV